MKRNRWQLAIVIIVLLVSLLLALDIERPEWVESLLFWLPPGSREISLRQGLDLRGGNRITLAIDEPGVPAETLETARQVIEQRISALSLTAPIVEIEGETRILAQVPATWETRLVTTTIQATALVEFIDGGYDPPDNGSLVATTWDEPQPTEEPFLTSPPIQPIRPYTDTEPLVDTIPPTATTPLTATAPVTATAPLTLTDLLTPTAPVGPEILTGTVPVTTTEEAIPDYETETIPLTTTDETGPVYDTVLSNQDLLFIVIVPDEEIEPGESGDYTISFWFTEQAASRFRSYAASHGGDNLCIALDKEVVACARLPSEPIEGRGGSLPTYLAEETASRIAATFNYAPLGALPVPLRVEEIGPAEPTMGEQAVAHSGRAVIVGLCALALLLLLYHRLPGLLTILGLLAFALISIALLKTIPLPVTLPSVTAFVVTSLLTLGALFSAFEHLRTNTRQNGQITTRSIEGSFARAWPAARSAHLLLLVIALVAWYAGHETGSDAVNRMGSTLVASLLVSLFVTRFVTRSLSHLILGSAREWASEKKWPLGI